MEAELSIIEEQAIKAARFAHRILLTVSIATLVFGFAPQEDNIYKNAVKETNMLLSLDMDRIVMDFVRNKCTIQEIRDHFTTFNSISKDFGIEYSPDTDDYNQHFSVSSYNNNLHWNNIESIDRYFNEISEVSVSLLLFSKSELQQIRNCLENNRSELAEFNKLTSIKPQLDKAKNKTLIIELKNNNNSLKRFPLTISDWPARSRHHIDFDPYSVLSIYPQWSGLIETKGDNKIFLPNLNLLSTPFPGRPGQNIFQLISGGYLF